MPNLREKKNFRQVNAHIVEITLWKTTVIGCFVKP